MLHNYTKHKNSKMFAVAYSSVGEAVDHIEVTEVNEKKAIEEFEQRMGIFPFGYYVIFTKTAPYYYNLGGGVGGGAGDAKEVYVEFLNKDKGYKYDIKHFKSYEQAVKWIRKSFDKFSPDMIKYKKYKMENGGGVSMAKDGLLIGDLRKELNRINSNIIELEEELKSPDVSDYRINQIEVVLLPDLEYGRSLYLSTLKNKLNRRYLETGKAIKEDLPLMNSKKEEYIIHGKGFKNGGGVGSDDSILNLFKKNKINKNSKEAYAEWENEVIEVIEYNENINRSQAQEIVDAKELEMAHCWSNDKPAFNTAQVILGKKLVSSGRSNPFDYKGKTDKIKEITREIREIAKEINPTKREVRREIRM